MAEDGPKWKLAAAIAPTGLALLVALSRVVDCKLALCGFSIAFVLPAACHVYCRCLFRVWFNVGGFVSGRGVVLRLPFYCFPCLGL